MPSSTKIVGPQPFELDDEHQQFRAVCRALVEKHLMDAVADAEKSCSFPIHLWKVLSEAGLLGLTHPEEFGGVGGDTLAVAILAEELARASGGIAITPLVSSYMAAPHLAKFGSTEQRNAYLRPVLSGEKVASIAVTEPGAGSDVASIRTRATKVRDGWLLDGTKLFITNGGIADFVIVAAKSDLDVGHRGITIMIVERGDQGFTVGRALDKMGWRSSDTRELVFQDCFVPDESVVGATGRGFYQIMECFETERIVLAAMGVGLAAAALEESIDYAKDRHAFGSPIASYQAVRHQISDMVVDVQAARLMTYWAAAQLDVSDPTAPLATAMAKLLGASVANRVADAAVQVFGGYGFIEESRVAMHYRDARVLRIGGGTDEILREIIAKRMGLGR